MCNYSDYVQAQGEAIGEARGKMMSIIELVLEGTISKEIGASKAKVAVDVFSKILEKDKATGEVVLM